MNDIVRIVHAADIHLDSPMNGLSRLENDDLAHQLRAATRNAFHNLVDYCLETHPNALVIAGDLYDGNWKDYSTGIQFITRMEDLRAAGIPVMLVTGNHDAASVISRNLTPPDNVKVFATDACETHIAPDSGLAFHAQGYPHPAVDRNLAVGYNPAIPGLVNVGILHTQVEGQAGHDNYAPCRLEHLIGRHYEYFALGHVHQRSILHAGRTTVAYPGNLQGRKPSESGAKGALDVSLTVDGEAVVSFVELDVARWAEVHLDLTGVEAERDALDRVRAELSGIVASSGGGPVIARVHMAGVSPLAKIFADHDHLAAAVESVAQPRGVVLDKVTSSVTMPRERRALVGRQRDHLLEQVHHLTADPTLLRADKGFTEDFDALVAEVNAAFTRDAGLDLDDHDELARVVAEACDRLLARMDGGL